MTKTDDWGYMVHSLERTVRHFAHAARPEYLRTESLTQPFAFLPELIILPALAHKQTSQGCNSSNRSFMSSIWVLIAGFDARAGYISFEQPMNCLRDCDPIDTKGTKAKFLSYKGVQRQPLTQRKTRHGRSFLTVSNRDLQIRLGT